MSNLKTTTIARIAEHTEWNAHTDAIIVLAHALKERYLIDQLATIKMNQERLGYLTHEESTTRYTMLNWLLDYAAEEYDNIDAIRAAF